jgi:hypothetical protein
MRRPTAFVPTPISHRLVKMELALPIKSLRLPRPGRYELALLFDGQELATQLIDAEVANGETG